ncbi:hypothetical protein [Agaribacterium sp. ZY112]|uniref:hypothetical protein n=1 Tax=Agaribacterium sp. ZY112 TaxID=3233574 RepID=UPI003524DB99
MKKILTTFCLMAFSGITHSEILKGLFLTNDQGALYENTLITCLDNEVVYLYGKGANYDDLVSYYFSANDKLNKYGELYVELDVVEYEQIDKVKYPKDHHDSTAVVIAVLKKDPSHAVVATCKGGV